jgi:hypothetical protein
MKTGTVGILNVGAGDIEIRFDGNNASERIRAARIVKDMLRRGYALLVEVERDGEKHFERALDFDEKTCRYIIADFDPAQAHEADMVEGAQRLRDEDQQGADYGKSEQTEAETPPESTGETKRRPGRPAKTTSVDASKTRAVAVGRSAGG